jgi:adenylate cyclase
VPLVASRRLIHGLICAGIFAAVAIVYWAERTERAGRTLTSWEYRFRDVIAKHGRFTNPDDRLLFLAIDNASNSVSNLDLETLFANVPANSSERRALALMAGWPWSRELYGLIAERLLTAGARIVALDLLLQKPGSGDEVLLECVQRFPNRIVLGSNFVAEEIAPRQQAWSLYLPAPTVVAEPATDHPAIGYVNFWRDSDGIVRRAQYRVTLEQLQANAPPPRTETGTPASLALRVATNLGVDKIDQPFAPRLFRYSGPPGTFRAVPVFQIFVPRYWEVNFSGGARLRNKIVIIGPYGDWAHDEHATPFGPMAGPELQLNAINALLHHSFIRELPLSLSTLLIAAAAAASWALAMLLKTMWLRLAGYVAGAAAYFLLVKFAYDNAGIVLLGIPPVLTFGSAGLVSFVYDYARETVEKLRIRRTLESYVSKEVVSEVIDNPASYLSSLGGRRVEVAAIVTDLRAFTTMSEAMESTKLVAQLNEYLGPMVEDIFACRGSVINFKGDAVLAVWGHVNSDGPAKDTVNAVEAALRMKQTLCRLNSDWAARGLRPFAMGCGLNFGEVVFGNIGSMRKMEPTVIGDTVNVTARLEGMTKDYGREILLGEAAADLVRGCYRLQLVDQILLKGKTRPLKVYSVLASADAPIDPATSIYLETYEHAQSIYVVGSFGEAATQFERCLEQKPGDALAAIYVRRCRHFMEHPPEEEWTGVYVAEHK